MNSNSSVVVLLREEAVRTPPAEKPSVLLVQPPVPAGGSGGWAEGSPLQQPPSPRHWDEHGCPVGLGSWEERRPDWDLESFQAESSCTSCGELCRSKRCAFPNQSPAPRLHGASQKPVFPCVVPNGLALLSKGAPCPR